MKKNDDTSIQELWEAFFASKLTGNPDPNLERKLVEHYYFLVKIAAQKMHKKNKNLSIEEFQSFGVEGLYQTINRYDPTKYNNKFETYAMPRIRGSMLDKIRQDDWVPRLVRSNSSWLDRQRNIYESEAQRHLSVSELYEMIPQEELHKQKIYSLDKFEKFVESSTTVAMHSVYDAHTEGDDQQLSIEQINDPSATQPMHGMLRKELFAKLMGKNFTPQERKIIWYFYFEDLSLKEIGPIVGLSESRVSQMHGDIKQRLEKKAERNPKYFQDIFKFVSEFKGIAA